MKNFDMKDFEKSVNLLVDGIIDTADELFANDEVKAYFVEYYNYEDGLDDTFNMLIQYIQDKY